MSSSNKNPTNETKTKEQLKAERKAMFEAQNADRIKKGEKEKPKSKSERRALQEAQRAAKKEQPQTDVKPKPVQAPVKVKTENDAISTRVSFSEPVDAVVKTPLKSKENEPKKLSVSTTRINIRPPGKHMEFPHIPRREENIDEFIKNYNNIEDIHPNVVKIGVQMNKGLLNGSTQRCLAMLAAFKLVINDYETPPQKELCRDLKALIDTCSDFLHKCRPLSISMKNGLQMLSMKLTKLTPDVTDVEAKKTLISCIDDFMEEIGLALSAMSSFTLEKINDGDVILTFGTSLSVKHILHSAIEKKKKFRVIVVDCRPKHHSKDMLHFLLSHNVDVTYIYINAISYVMKEVTKVIIGAHSILANGYVLAKLGTSQIALVAQAYNVPFIVCCEGFKFSEKVLTDSFVYNESGEAIDFLDDESFTNKNGISKMKTNSKLSAVNLFYDVTPPDFISMVVTESGIIPCNSVPAVIRRKVYKFH